MSLEQTTAQSFPSLNDNHHHHHNNNNNSNNNSNFNHNNNTSFSKVFEQPPLPQRKKPGRKPNPASPALRKAQNRAAQRAFRERKERHLRELEDTIKAQRDNQQQSDIKYQKEILQLRSIIQTLENEKRYWKDVSLTFEYALNHFHENTDITSKIKSTLMSSSRLLLSNPISTTNTTQPFEFAQQNDNRFTLALDDHSSKMLDTPIPLSANLPLTNESETFLPSPANSSTTLSPLSTPPSLHMNMGPISPPLNNTYSFNDGLNIHEIKQMDHKGNGDACDHNTTISSPYLTEEYLDSFMKNLTGDYGQVLPLYGQHENQSAEMLPLIQPTKHSDPVTQQLILLAKLVGARDLSGVNPRIRYPLTTQQMYYLQQPHDPRIKMIPSLHLRARMIEYRDSYDIYELCDLLIRKAKCHGDDPLDPDAWEMPEEFFEKYGFLAFSQCRIKSNLYRQNPRIPAKDLSEYLKKRTNMYLVSS